jgi:hypothetical protein
MYKLILHSKHIAYINKDYANRNIKELTQLGYCIAEC